MIKTILRKFKITICLLLISNLKLCAQNTNDASKPPKEFKNTFRFNLTNPIIFGNKSIIFGYERVLNNNQSFSINIGQTGFPKLGIVSSEDLKVESILKESGFHISGDYRFYLSKENKYHAPRGVYIGPYYGYNYFDKKHSWKLNSTTSGFDGNVNSDLSLRIQTFGVEMGYQFIFWKRIALDFILIGPGVGIYSLQAKLDTDLSQEDATLFFEKLNDALADKFPGYNATIGEDEFKKKGTKNTTTLGYRYVIQLGYRF
jgi:hypothetical protein